jgi:hypothetical protein
VVKREEGRLPYSAYPLLDSVSTSIGKLAKSRAPVGGLYASDLEAKPKHECMGKHDFTKSVIYIYIYTHTLFSYHEVAWLIEAPCYKPECRGFDSR